MLIFAAAIISQPIHRGTWTRPLGLSSGFSLRMRQTSPAEPKTGRPSRKVNPLLALIKNMQKKPAKELSLRPYNGRLFIAQTRGDYEKAHKWLFKTPDVLTCAQEGRFTGGEGKDGIWTYLVWAELPHTLTHELSHVVLHVFERCGIDPREGNGEPFCYLLSQLILDAGLMKKRKAKD